MGIVIAPLGELSECPENNLWEGLGSLSGAQSSLRKRLLLFPADFAGVHAYLPEF